MSHTRMSCRPTFGASGLGLPILLSVLMMLTVTVACGGSERGRDRGHLPSSATLRATLFFSDVQLAPGRTFPSPLVRGSVNGKPTVLVVDTGAQVAVVDAALAASAGLDVAGRVEAHDPSSNAVEMRTTARPCLTIDGLGPVADRPTAVVALPSILTRLGIGAIVSPQALAVNGTEVVLDLGRRELRIDAAASVSRDAGGNPTLDLGPMEMCRFQEGGLEAKALIVRANVDGKETALEVDTGASTTFVVAESDAGRTLGNRPDAQRATAVGAAGPIDIVRLERVAVRSGAVALDGALSVMPGAKDARCGYEGRIGIDRLTLCRLVLREGSVRGSCLPAH